MARSTSTPTRTASRAVVPSGAAGAALTGDATSAVSPVWGVNLVVNGVPVSITASSFDKTKGFEFTLPGPVILGSIADLSATLNTSFGITLPDLTTLPSPFDKIASGITNAVFSVQTFHLRVPPSTAADQTVGLTFVMECTLATADQPSLLGVTFTGASFGVSNEQSPAVA